MHRFIPFNLSSIGCASVLTSLVKVLKGRKVSKNPYEILKKLVINGLFLRAFDRLNDDNWFGKFVLE